MRSSRPKRNFLLLNKADLVPEEVRIKWAQYLEQQVDASRAELCFAAPANKEDPVHEERTHEQEQLGQGQEHARTAGVDEGKEGHAILGRMVVDNAPALLAAFDALAKEAGKEEEEGGGGRRRREKAEDERGREGGCGSLTLLCRRASADHDRIRRISQRGKELSDQFADCSREGGRRQEDLGRPRSVSREDETSAGNQSKELDQRMKLRERGVELGGQQKSQLCPDATTDYLRDKGYLLVRLPRHRLSLGHQKQGERGAGSGEDDDGGGDGGALRTEDPHEASHSSSSEECARHGDQLFLASLSHLLLLRPLLPHSALPPGPCHPHGATGAAHDLQLSGKRSKRPDEVFASSSSPDLSAERLHCRRPPPHSLHVRSIADLSCLVTSSRRKRKFHQQNSGNLDLRTGTRRAGQGSWGDGRGREGGERGEGRRGEERRRRNEVGVGGITILRDYIQGQLQHWKLPPGQ
eukprot:557759-Hanusia_phi.AAC.3